MSIVFNSTTSITTDKRNQLTPVSLEEFVRVIESNNSDVYELTPDNKQIKLYFDYDCSVDCAEYNEQTNQRIGALVEKYILEFYGRAGPMRISVASASSSRYLKTNKTNSQTYEAKYSWRFYTNDIIATKKEQKKMFEQFTTYVAEVEAACPQLPGELKKTFDSSVYSANRWMRCVGTSKPFESRPLMMVKGCIQDTIISDGFAEGCLKMEAPKEENKKKTVVPTTTNQTSKCTVESYIKLGIENNIFDKITGHDKWRDIGFILHDAMGDEGEDLFVELSRNHPQFEENHVRAQYKIFGKAALPAGSKRVGLGTLIKYYNDADKDVSNQIKTGVRELSGERCAPDDTTAARLILDDLEGVLVADSHGRLFMKTGHIWVEDKDTIYNHLMRRILESGISYPSRNSDSVAPYTSNMAACKRVYETVIILVKTEPIIGDDIYIKFHNTTLARLCFQDGVLDFRTKQFYTWDEIDFEYYTTIMIPYEMGEYFKNPDRDVMAEVKETVYNTLFGSKLETALQFISRAICSHIEDKNWGSFLGNRDCGKGVLFESLKQALGKYIDSFELCNIMYARKTDTEEISRKLYWTLELEFARLVISQEVPKDPNLKVSGRLFKKLVGGGDEQKARRNFDRKDTTFIIDSTFLIMGNNELKFDEVDCLEHCVQFESVAQFRSQKKIDALKAECNNPLVWEVFRVKDDAVKKEQCPSLAWKRATIMLLFEHYSTEAVETEESDDIDEIPLRRVLLEKCEITRDSNDMVLVSNMCDFIDGDKKKIINELASMGIKKVKSTHRDHTRNKAVFVGIKLIRDDTDNNEEDKETDII